MPNQPKDSPPEEDSDLTVQVYSELRDLAAAYLRGRRDHTLQPTALVNEVWLRLEGRAGDAIRDRDHFLALAATVMRQLLIDHARAKDAQKRGGQWRRVTLGEAISGEEEREVDLLDLDQALDRLERMSPDRARLVELRYFGGLTLERTATIIGISRSEAARRWRSTIAWLAAELGGKGEA